MKITGDLPAPELDPKKTQGTAKSGRAEAVRKVSSQSGDSIELSGRAQELAQWAARIEKAPVAEPEKVDAIRRAVADGSYAFSPELVAERMLSSLSHHPAGI